jgi:hypothetical protein
MIIDLLRGVPEVSRATVKRPRSGDSDCMKVPKPPGLGPVLTTSDYLESRTLGELRRRFRKAGMWFLAERAMVRRAREEWWALTRKPQGPVGRFTAREVRVGDTVAWIHGIVHGGRIVARVSPAVRKELRERIAELRRRGCAVIVEQGLKDLLFRGLGVEEMDDFTYTLRKWPNQMWAAILKFSGRALVSPILIPPTLRLAERMEDKSGGREWGVAAAIRRALTDIRWLEDLDNAAGAARLPEPLEREFLVKHNPSEAAILSFRSERMADCLFEASSRTGSRAIHAVVGAGHAPAMEYYLARRAASVSRTRQTRVISTHSAEPTPSSPWSAASS